jgi:phage terminase large subunit
MLLPHDVQVRELGTGRSRLEVLQEAGLSCTVVPRLGVADGIQAVRQLLPNCWFSLPKVKQGLECLRNYRREYDEKRSVYFDKPLHDWASHGSDAFRYLAVGMNDTSSWSKPLKVNTGWVV